MTVSARQPHRAGTFRLGLYWARVELRLFWRIPAQVFFTFALPVLFLVIFAAVFSGDIDAGPGRSVSFVQYFLPGIIGAGVMSSTFGNLASSISVQQHTGLLKRLGGTPFPRGAYFMGKVLEAVVVAVLQTVLMLVIAVLAYGAELPADASRWATFIAVLILASATGAALGIAYTRAIPNANAAAAIIQPPFLVLQFISGVFFRHSEIPGWLRAVAAVFPLRWMSEGFRYAFLPDWFGKVEYGSTWGWQWPIAILAIWMLVAAALAFLLFRWDRSSGE
ncbi:MAG: ABC transporter permease [Anaerolineaceae bacterium]